jgi:hypothetical protein
VVTSALWSRGPLETHLQGRGLPRHWALALIHRNVWKGDSANFAFTEFSEVRASEDPQRQVDGQCDA